MPGDRAFLLGQSPSIVHVGGNIQRTDLANGRLHIHHRFVVHAIVDTDTALLSICVPVWHRCDEAFFTLGIAVRPETLKTRAMLIPSLEGPAAA